jgi:hypothetical protein
MLVFWILGFGAMSFLSIYN